MSYAKLGNYTVYSSGKITSSYGWRGKQKNEISHVMDDFGYPCVRLVINGKRKKWKLHKLIAELFLPAPTNQNAMVCHKDGNKLNNAVSNLYWGDAKTNARDRDKHGKTSRGHYHSKRIRAGLKQAKANANLIAAAPEMLEALEAVVDSMTLGKPVNTFVDKVSNAIKKAKGL